MLWLRKCSRYLSIYLSIYILTYIAPLQGNYSEALPGPAKEESLEEFIKRTGKVPRQRTKLTLHAHGCCLVTVLSNYSYLTYTHLPFVNLHRVIVVIIIIRTIIIII